MGASAKRKRGHASKGKALDETKMPPTPNPPPPLPMLRAKPLVLSSEAVLRTAMQHLINADLVLKPLIEQHGMPKSLIAKTRSRSCFHALAEIIVYQQLSIKAARPIFQRVMTACSVPVVSISSSMPPATDDPDDDSQVLAPDSSPMLTPASVLTTDMEALRAAGLSNNKARFLVDLAQFFDDGRLSDDALMSATSIEEVSDLLLPVKGLGPWSVCMLRMFHLGHADVLPLGDLGVRRGLAHLYNIKDDKDTETMQRVTEAWRPYRSVGAWYLWRVKTPPQRKAKKQSSKYTVVQ